MPSAVVAGCSGQDGTYLSALLVEKGYEVFGLDHSRAAPPPGISFSALDVCDAAGITRLVRELRPEEIYCLAAFHHSSEAQPGRADRLMRRSFEVNTLAIADLLEAVAEVSPASRVFYAASSRVFGAPADDPQNESTPLNPVCAYGISKAAGIQACRFYRDRRGVFSSVGILYNHESPLRPSQFVSTKIVRGAVAIQRGALRELEIADLDAAVDWGYAPDYTEAMWTVLQLEAPGDFVIASGELHTVREFAMVAFEVLGMNWEDHVRQKERAWPNPKGTTQTAKPLRGDSRRLRSLSGWRPRVGFRQMVAQMVEAEVEKEAGPELAVSGRYSQ